MSALAKNIETELQTVPSTTNEMIFDSAVMVQMQAVAKLMASGRSTVPQHLQKSPGDCFAIVMQSAMWKMNPFAVAQKTHLVQGTLGYEAQLVNAVITSMAPTKGRLEFEWFGPWEKILGNFTEKTSQAGKKYMAPNWKISDEKGLGVRVWATLKGEEEPRILEILLLQAQVRNSTLWASDPKQQLAYLAIKRWSRLYCPDVIMGVYTADELGKPEVEKEINPHQNNPDSRVEQLKAKARTKANKPSEPVAMVPETETNADEINLAFVCEAIASAKNDDELAAAADLANALNDHDKAIARDEYKARLDELKAK